MSTHNAAWRTAYATWDFTQFNGGSIVALTSANAILVTWPLGTPWASVSGPTATALNTPLEVNASAAGVIDHYEMRNSGGTIVKTLTSGEVTLTGSTTVASGQPVRISSLSITAPN